MRKENETATSFVTGPSPAPVPERKLFFDKRLARAGIFKAAISFQRFAS